MLAVTVSPKFQVVIPQAVREQLHIEAGQKLQVLAYEHRIEFLPVESPQTLRGFLPGIATDVPSLRDLQAEQRRLEQAGKPVKAFKTYPLGYVHIDLKYLPRMADETRRCYLYVAIERSTRWVHMEIHGDKSAETASRFLQNAIDKAPFHIKTILTDNGKEFTDRFVANGEREPTGSHLFDQVCTQQSIEHRLIKPRHPQTNGMVERFNGRISEILATHHYDSRRSLAEALEHYLMVYNYHIPQKALGHKTPVQALKEWQKKAPELFNKSTDDQPGLDS